MPNIIAAIILSAVVWAIGIALCDVIACNGGIANACVPVNAYYRQYTVSDTTGKARP